MKDLNFDFVYTMYESEEIKKSFQDKDGKYPESVILDHTLRFTFDFSDVALKDFIANNVSTTTTVWKQYYNNFLRTTDKDGRGVSALNEAQIIEKARASKSKRILVNVQKDIYDGKATRTSNPDARLAKSVQQMLLKGKTQDEIKKALQAQLAALESIGNEKA